MTVLTLLILLVYVSMYVGWRMGRRSTAPKYWEREKS